jgi:hypothetical protein
MSDSDHFDILVTKLEGLTQKLDDIVSTLVMITNKLEHMSNVIHSSSSYKQEGITICIAATYFKSNSSIYGCHVYVKEKAPLTDIRIVNDNISKGLLLALRMGLEQIQLYPESRRKVTVLCNSSWLADMMSNRVSDILLEKDCKELVALNKELMKKMNIKIMDEPKSFFMQKLFEHLEDTKEIFKEKETCHGLLQVSG